LEKREENNLLKN